MFGFAFDDTQRSMRDLLLEVKSYVGLQKRFLQLDLTEKLTVLLSGIAIAAICILLGSMILLYLTFALAHWIGEITGILAVGFLVIAIVIAILLAVIYTHRNKWIVQPLARMMVTLFINPDDEKSPDEPPADETK